MKRITMMRTIKMAAFALAATLVMAFGYRTSFAVIGAMALLRVSEIRSIGQIIKRRIARV